MVRYEFVKDVNIPELEYFYKYTENQLAHIYEPELGLFIAESAKVILRAMDAGYKPITFLSDGASLQGEVKEVFDRLDKTEEEYIVYVLKEKELKNLIGFKLARGILCTMRRLPAASPEIILNSAKRIAVLGDVENPTNVGAVFRSAAALNIDAAVLTKGCCDPLYRRCARVSMGNIFLLPWVVLDEYEMGDCLGKKISEMSETQKKVIYIEYLKKLGYKTVCMALTENTVEITNPFLKSIEKMAIILGNEGEGLPEETISACDYCVKIPMAEGVDSLNVAAAAAIAFWELAGKEG